MKNLIFITSKNSVRVFYNQELECFQVFRRHEMYGSEYDVVGFYDENVKPISGKEMLTKGQIKQIKPSIMEYLHGV